MRIVTADCASCDLVSLFVRDSPMFPTIGGIDPSVTVQTPVWRIESGGGDAG